MRRTIAFALAAAFFAVPAVNAHAVVRWFEPDAGQPVQFAVVGGGVVERNALDQAIAAWNGVACSSLVLELVDDSHNVIAFDDPSNVIADPANCGGVLAVSGPSVGGATRVVNGVTYRQILDADITLANGFAGCSYWTETNIAEVLTRAIGRSIGVLLSEPFAHLDGAGATLTPDEEAALCAVYPLDIVGEPPVDPPNEAPGDVALNVRSARVRRGRITVAARLTTPTLTNVSDVAAQPVTISVGGVVQATVPPGAWTTQRGSTLVYKDADRKLTLRGRPGIHYTVAFTATNTDLVDHGAAGLEIAVEVGGKRYVGSK